MSMIIYGEQGHGKTVFKQVLAKHFGYPTFINGWNPQCVLPDDTLAFTNCDCRHIKGAVEWLDAIEVVLKSTLNQQRLLKKWVSLRDCTLKPVAETIVEIRSSTSGVAGYEVVTTKQIISLSIRSTGLTGDNCGCFFCNTCALDFVGSSVRGVWVVDELVDDEAIACHGFVLFDQAKAMVVNIETSFGTLQFVAYNSGDGSGKQQAKVQSALMTHSQIL